jgi:nicotinamidase-related amidase
LIAAAGEQLQNQVDGATDQPQAANTGTKSPAGKARPAPVFDLRGICFIRIVELHLSSMSYRRKVGQTATLLCGKNMEGKLAIDAKASALLVMDFQRTIVENHASESTALLERTADLIASARQAGLRIIYVVVGFRSNYPEVNPRNLSFTRVRSGGRFLPDAPGSEIHPAVAARPEDVIVTKHRVSAFAGTDLDLILRANGIETLLLAGISTSGVVLSTLRHAADADYRLLVVRDCCGDADAEVHRVLTEKVFPRQATVTTAEAILQVLF